MAAPTSNNKRLLIIAIVVICAMAAAVAAWFIFRVTAPRVAHTIQEQFTEYVPTVGAVDGILETATCCIEETFKKSDSATLFDIIPLGTTVTEIRIPAVYTYHIKLYDPWKIETRGNVCMVTAPQFKPSLPPAVITEHMDVSSSEGWLRFNGHDDLMTLERGITRELDQRASDQTHCDYVREACRKSVADFVKNWLLAESQWRTDSFHQIVVIFPDDPPLAPGLTERPPTLSLESGTGASPSASPDSPAAASPFPSFR